MAHFEMYVDTGQSNDNGGSSPGAPDYTLTGGAGSGCTATNDTGDSKLEDLDGGNWSGVTVGDIVAFESGGAGSFQHTVVTQLNRGGLEFILCSPQVGADTDVDANVGGAFADPDFAVGIMDSLVGAGEFSDGTPPWLNLLEGQTHTLSSTITSTANGTVKQPLGMGGYQTTPRDAGGTKPIIQFSGTPMDTAAFDFMRFAHLHFKHTGNNASNAFDVGSSLSLFFEGVIFEATDGTGAVLVSSGPTNVFVDCEVKNSGTATGVLLSSVSSPFINTEFSGGDSSDFSFSGGTYMGCKMNGVEMFAQSNTFIAHSCLFEPGAAMNGLLVDANVCDLVFLRNCIFQDAPATFYGLNSDEANYSMAFGGNNLWYNPLAAGHRNQVDNYPGDNDVEDSDPNLDGNDRAQSGSAAIGAGFPLYIDIGRVQHQDAGGGGATRLVGGVLVN